MYEKPHDQHSKDILILGRHLEKAGQLSRMLQTAGFICHIAVDSSQAIGMLNDRKIDLIALDPAIPGMGGFHFCRILKEDGAGAAIPIVFIASHGDESARLEGLESGADDYIIETSNPRELVLRLKAILRRHQPRAHQENIITLGDVTLDVLRHKVLVRKSDVRLAAIEFKLLTVLMQKRGCVMTRECLLNDVWGIDSEIYTRTVDAHIRLLRRKLGKAGKYIETVFGVGYRFREH